MNKQNRTRDIAFTGIYIALIMGVGYALFLVPLELVTAMVFMAGVLMGRKRGLLIGLLGEFLYSALNPLGSGLLYPTGLAMQVLAMGLIGLCGAFLRSTVLRPHYRILDFILLGLSGFGLTLIFDVLVSIGFSIAAGFNWRAIVSVFTLGTIFHGTRLLTNTVIFMAFVPVTSKRVRAAIPYFRDRK